MLDDLLAANRTYAANFALAGVAPAAARRFALVTCMDTRIEPLGIFGLRPGDAKIIRNGGGRVTPDVLRSLVLATSFLGVEEIAVMQHTRCALADRSDDDVRADLPADRRAVADQWQFGGMPDPDAALLADVQLVRACPLLPAGVTVEGWRYDVDSGIVSRVVPLGGSAPVDESPLT
jgi:carbonic anhydrase